MNKRRKELYVDGSL